MKEQMQAAKNAVFAAKQAAENQDPASKAFPAQRPIETGGVPTKSRAQAAMEKFGIKIPVGTVPLPSQGMVYSQNHPFHRQESVEYRGMTTREEDILTNAVYVKRGTVIDELIKSCLINKNVDVRSLISGDRNALMIAIRATGYGQIYSPSFACPNPACKEVNHLNIDLAQLPVKNLTIQPRNEYENVFSFEMPSMQNQDGKPVEVLFRFLTGQDELDIQATLKANKKKGSDNAQLVTTRLQHCIVSINGITNRHDISEGINYLPASDALALRDYIDKHEPGVDMTIDFSCEHCEHEAEVVMPMDATFFWPNART